MKLEDFLIDKTATLTEALAQLDATGRHCLFVTTPEGELLGSLTDGDIRRIILREGSINGKVIDATNFNPVYVSAENSASALSIINKKSLSAIPVVDDSHIVVDIVFPNANTEGTDAKLDEPIPVVMMAGGIGSRLMPLTAVLPKPLIPIKGITIAERIMDLFYKGGCNSFFLILNYKKEMIRAYFEGVDTPYSISFVYESDYLGTGGGLGLIKDKVSSTFFLTNCDILIDLNLKELYEVHKRSGNAITVVCSLKGYQIPYGTIDIDQEGEIATMNEKPLLNYLVNTGCYVVEPIVLNCINDEERIDFPDIVERCQKLHLRVGVFPVSEGAWMDMGEMSEMRSMMRSLAESENEAR